MKKRKLIERIIWQQEQQILMMNNIILAMIKASDQETACDEPAPGQQIQPPQAEGLRHFQ